MPDGAERPFPIQSPNREPAPQALLQIWLSPAFPVGAFAYSHGLEKAAEFGWIRDRPTLEAWLGDIVLRGSLQNDLILLSSAWHATAAQDRLALHATAELAAAFQPSAERYLEAMQQGRSFLVQIASAWPSPALGLLERMDSAGPAYPVAVAMAAADHGIPLADTLRAYGLAFTGNIVSAAIRLSIIGQTDGQKTIATLLPSLESTVTIALAATLDDLGSSTFSSDLASLAHETQYTRLFRS